MDTAQDSVLNYIVGSARIFYRPVWIGLLAYDMARIPLKSEMKSEREKENVQLVKRIA